MEEKLYPLGKENFLLYQRHWKPLMIKDLLFYFSCPIILQKEFPIVINFGLIFRDIFSKSTSIENFSPALKVTNLQLSASRRSYQNCKNAPKNERVEGNSSDSNSTVLAVKKEGLHQCFKIVLWLLAALS